MNKKVCLITGANSGIGKAAAIQIARKGYHVIIACRSQSRGEAALKEIRDTSNSSSVELMIVDMSLQASIRNMANLFLEKYDTLDVLIHNAAVFDISEKKPTFTEEGIESIWATNHVGPMLLTELLIEPLKSSNQGRIITIASKGLITFPFLKINLVDPEFRNRKFSVVNAYYQAKLAQVMYTYWLAQRLENTKITVNCIRVTNVKVDISRHPNISSLARYMYSIKSKFSLSTEEMARTYTYLATSDELSSITGKYFDENNKCIKSSVYSCNKENMDKVMNLTMKYFIANKSLK
jgi:NAD(P)-dependent dehydrogenase (short-subunit alcohol dehydrogenase family)